MKIQCRTLFDCSHTGITGHFRPSTVPFEDQTGQTINNQQDWNRARNQQRNWETIVQMISLRTQPMAIGNTTVADGAWEFSFEIETPGVYSANGDIDNYDSLLSECSGIPMIVGLDEINELAPELIATGSKQNIWFNTINN
jgi:hypothetical protein